MVGRAACILNILESFWNADDVSNLLRSGFFSMSLRHDEYVYMLVTVGFKQISMRHSASCEGIRTVIS